MFNTVLLIGCGGVGSHLLFPLATQLRTLGNPKLLLIDGDGWEEKNGTRCLFSRPPINKAVSLAGIIKEFYPEVKAIPRYLGTKPTSLKMEELIREITPPSLWILGVDNDATRRLVSKYLYDVYIDKYYLINAANFAAETNAKLDFLDKGMATTQYYFNGETSLPLTRFSNIKNPMDKIPDEDCLTEAVSNPQMLSANLAAVIKCIMIIEQLLVSNII